MATKVSKIKRSASTGRFVVKEQAKPMNSGTVKTSSRSTEIMDKATKKYHSALRNLAKK